MFVNSWPEEPEFYHFVEQHWQAYGDSINSYKLQNYVIKLSKWSKENYYNTTKEIGKCKK